MSPKMTDAQWMRRAISLAAHAQGRTAPNPMVGAVIVRDGEVLAEGFHHAPGLAHGEVDALRKLPGRKAPGATMYVNLEPCCHYGRTPPCTDAILHSGISRVVVGMEDPDKRMQGKSVRLLREHGVEVEVGIAEAESRRLNAAYLTAAFSGRPLFVLKAAITLDGRIADAQGHSQWITGPEARAAGHALRDQLDAVMVGSGTLLADNPSLNTRIEAGRDALPVLLDSNLRCPPDARVLTAGRRPLIFCALDAPQRELPADVVRIARDADGRLALEPMCGALRERDVHSVLVEGGAQVHRSLLDAGIVDRIELFVAPKVLAAGDGFVGGPGYLLKNAPTFRVLSVEKTGEDVRITLEPPTVAWSRSQTL